MAVGRAKAKLDRHAVDSIARAVISGRRGHGRNFDRLADAASAMVRNRLEAAGAPGAARARASKRPGQWGPQPEIIRRILARVEKLLAALAAETADGAPHARRS